MSAEAIHDQFIVRASELTGLEVSAEDALGPMPTFTLSRMLPTQEDVETGPAMEVTHRWLVRLYVDKNQQIPVYEKQLVGLAYSLYRVPRLYRSLDGLCYDHALRPRDEEFRILDDAVVASIVLEAVADES